ncbi:MAG: transcription-repair coupling factor [Eubacteriales bacterium]|nr:transcription-repair coupling factor [Eubacteriales bacterium]
MYNALKQIESFNNAERELKKAPVPISISGCIESQKVQVAAELGKEYSWKLFICKDEKTAQDIVGDYKNFEDNVWFYPAKDMLFYSSDIHRGVITNQRMEALKHLMEDESGVIVTTIDGIMDKISSEKEVSGEKLVLREGMILNIGNFASIFQKLGYERNFQVELKGQYSIRGGIVDIYPVTADEPYRIELFDDEIDTIRSFDIESQRSIDRVEELLIYPADEKSGKGEVSLISYFSDTALIFMDNPERIRQRAISVEEEFRESMEHRMLDEKYFSQEEDENEFVADIFSAEEILDSLRNRRSVLFAGLNESLKDFGAQRDFIINTATQGSYKESFEMLIADLKKYADQGYRISILTPSHTRTSRLAENLRDYGIKAFCPDENDKNDLKPGEAEVIYGCLSHGYLYPDVKYALFTESDMFGASKARKKKKREKFSGQKLDSLSELQVGDYVVHESHGIGIYKCIEHIEREGNGKDYIKVEYADGGNLYIPATKLNLVQKFAGAEAKKPKLNKLNGTDWTKTRQRVTRAVNDIAKELIQLYASRIHADGFRYSEDTVWQQEFEEMFPFEETDDQIAAINAVKADMESGRIMDRLICGDVGYGKTEIALRAAFKAVQDGKQVAYLVPTTILAKQHYNTFVERIKNFPIEVDLMCRFKSAAENKLTAEKLKAGKVDIVIGTHRILSKDVEFKNIGLLIIDEEQRFGVAHKEKIKQLKNNIDVLTLTATPIPRTLHMSLAGIRDMSVLEEPPIDRLPIQTYVMGYNNELVREAVTRETQRGGQVYYVYNRVKDIEEKTDSLRRLLPDINIEYAHGQMNERELERIMLDFISGEIDMLVSTTIIETGLNIPNANTLIVDGAEKMGLSQLYQIRGRVGRSNKTSYAFLMYRRDKILSEEAEKRLKAIREFTEFGAGIKIAMRDLEIRGAGNVLGAEQHGQMEAVGYEMYCKLLNRAVKLLKGTEDEHDIFETTIDCDIDAFIPDSYIMSEYQKLDVYKRIADIKNEEECLDIQDELTDRFGDIPDSVMNLLTIAQFKADAHRAYATDITIRKNSFTIEMYQRADIRTEAIPELIVKERGRLKFMQGANPKFIYEDKKNIYSDAGTMLGKARELIYALNKESK